MTAYENILIEIETRGLSNIVFESHDKARNFMKNKGIVLIPDDFGEWFDIYFLARDCESGYAGEYCCWVGDELQEAYEYNELDYLWGIICVSLDIYTGNDIFEEYSHMGIDLTLF